MTHDAINETLAGLALKVANNRPESTASCTGHFKTDSFPHAC
jgi:hypothetical protein